MFSKILDFYDSEISKHTDALLSELNKNIDKLTQEDIDNIQIAINSLKDTDDSYLTKVKNDLQDTIDTWNDLHEAEKSPAEKLIDKYIEERVCGFLGANVDIEQLRLTLKDFAEYVLNA